MEKIITDFLDNLNPLEKTLIKNYIDQYYIPKVRTGRGNYNNFLYEHNSKKGVEIVKEIIKFKKLQFKSGFYNNNKLFANFVTKTKKPRSKPKK